MANRAMKSIIRKAVAEWFSELMRRNHNVNPYLLGRQDSQYGLTYVWYWHIKDIAEHVKVKVFFRWDDPLCQFRLQFMGQRAAYLNRKFALREPLTVLANTALRAVCKSKERLVLYVGEAA